MRVLRSAALGLFIALMSTTALFPEQAHAGTWWDWLTKADNKPGGKAAPFVRAMRSMSLVAFNRDDFDPQKVRMVDRVDSNVILRMSNPAINGEFCEDEFYQAIRNNLPADLSIDNSKIIVFNLMYSYMEAEEYLVEKNWFEAHPEHEFRNYPQMGGVLNAKAFPKPVRDRLKKRKNFLFQPAYQVVKDLRTEITTESQDERPKIIIVHCVSGRDRTGMIAGQYRMKYMEKNYAEVVKENQIIARKAQDVFSRTAMRWMALNLREKYPTVGTEDEILSLDDTDLSELRAQGIRIDDRHKGG